MPTIASPTLEIVSKGDPLSSHPPLLLIHGAWHGAWCWDKGFMDRLTRGGLRVHALSLRGHGGSTGDVRRARISHYVEDVERAVAKVGGNPILVGHSMGGHVARIVAEKRGAAGLVLMACVPSYGLLGSLGRLAVADPLAVLRGNATLSLSPVVSTDQKVKRLLFSKGTPNPVVADCAGRLGEESFPAYLDLLLPGRRIQARPDVSTLVLAGERDAVFTEADAQAIASEHGTHVKTFMGVGHDLMLEPGWELVADVVAHWCRSLGKAEANIVPQRTVAREPFRRAA